MMMLFGKHPEHSQRISMQGLVGCNSMLGECSYGFLCDLLNGFHDDKARFAISVHSHIDLCNVASLTNKESTCYLAEGGM